MAEIVLVHGANHGAWCWREVVPRLSAMGHLVRAIDLPGLGDDPTPRETVTLEGTVAALLDAVEGPAVVVGHSLGGVAITAAAEAAPDRIARLVYVTAWAPRDGEAARDLRAATGCNALLDAIVSEDGGVTTRFRDETLEPLLYHDCPPGTVELARARLVPQPASIGRTPVRVTARGAAVARSFVICDRDRAITPAAQAAQCAGWDDVHHLPCGHSPFFACPGALAGLIDAAARR